MDEAVWSQASQQIGALRKFVGTFELKKGDTLRIGNLVCKDKGEIWGAIDVIKSNHTECKLERRGHV